MTRLEGADELSAVTDRQEVRIPIVQEEAHVTYRSLPVERVRIETTVDSREELVTGNLMTEALEIARRPVERPVAVAPEPRQEGDSTIISIVEERAVVSRQLFVVEEVVVRARASAEPFSLPITLRRTRATVERETDPTHLQQEDH